MNEFEKEEEMLIKSVTITESSKIEAIINKNGTRYEISISKSSIFKDEEWTVAVPNFYFSMTTPHPTNCAYKLAERGIGWKDSQNVEQACKILFKQLQENKKS